jgi:hypothetical protein
MGSNDKFSVTLVKVYRLQEEQAISHDHHLIFPVAALTIKIKTMRDIRGRGANTSEA